MSTLPRPWITVVELPGFVGRAEKILATEERQALIELLARDPEAGDVIPDTGGVRKVRVGVEGRGKRGGARAIYFYFDATAPVLLLTIFAKNERSDLSAAERADLYKLTSELKRVLRTRRK